MSPPALLLLLSACAPKAPVAVPAAAPADVLELRVVDLENRPVADLAVVAVMSGSGERRELRTDADGVARLVRDEHAADILIDDEAWLGGGHYNLLPPYDRVQLLVVPRCTVEVQLTDGGLPAAGEVWNRRFVVSTLDDQGRATLDWPCGDDRLVWGPGVGGQRYLDLSPGLGGRFVIDVGAMEPFDDSAGSETYAARMAWKESGPKGTITGRWEGPQPCRMTLVGEHGWPFPEVQGCDGDGTLRPTPLPPGEWTVTVAWSDRADGARPEHSMAVVRTTLPPGGAVDLGTLRPGMGTPQAPLDRRPPGP